jgi:hypothetical protein
MRARYIFRTYDVNGDGCLDIAEMVHLIRHLRRGRGDSTAPEEVQQEAVAIMESICNQDGLRLSFAGFLQALPPFGDVLRGTSVLFRLGTSVSPKNIDIAALALASRHNASQQQSALDNLVPVHGQAASHPSSGDGAAVADKLGFALRICQQMDEEERTTFLSEFFCEFCADDDDGGAAYDTTFGNDEEPARSIDRGRGQHEQEYGQQVVMTSADEQDHGGPDGLHLYNWVADPEPHPGVRGLGTDDVMNQGPPAQFVSERGNDTGGARLESEHDRLIHEVLNELQELMEDEPNAVDFLHVLVSELNNVILTHEQQAQILTAVRSTLSHDTSSSNGVSTGMGIAAELLGTQQGDRLPSRRGTRATLNSTGPAAVGVGLRPEFRPGSAPAGPASRAEIGSDRSATARPTSADEQRQSSFVHGTLVHSAPSRAKAPADRTEEIDDKGRSRSETSATAFSTYHAAQLGAYDFVETVESASSVDSEEFAADKLGSDYKQATVMSTGGTSCTQRDSTSSDSSADSCSDSTISDDVARLAQQYSTDIKYNEAVRYELENTLTKFIEAGQTVNEHEDRGHASVTLSVQQLEMVALRVLAVVQDEQNRHFDSGLRNAIVAVHLQYAGMNALVYKDTLVQELSDLLYDEMIFSKVLQQVEQSYDRDIQGINRQRNLPEGESGDLHRCLEDLLAQRHNDVRRLHQEREKRFASKHSSAQLMTPLVSLGNLCADPASDSSSETCEPTESVVPVEIEVSAECTDGSVSEGQGLGSWTDDSGDDRAREEAVDVTIDDLPTTIVPSAPTAAPDFAGPSDVCSSVAEEDKISLAKEDEVSNGSASLALNAPETADEPLASNAPESADEAVTLQQPAPWTLKHVTDNVSKKMVVSWLQEHAPASLLSSFRLRGQVASIAKKRTKKEVVKAYAAYLQQA